MNRKFNYNLRGGIGGRVVAQHSAAASSQQGPWASFIRTPHRHCIDWLAVNPGTGGYDSPLSTLSPRDVDQQASTLLRRYPHRVGRVDCVDRVGHMLALLFAIYIPATAEERTRFGGGTSKEE